MIAVVGKPRDRYLAASIEQYESRAARYWPLEIVEVRGGSGRGVHPDDTRREEGARLLARVSGFAVIACDERGEDLNSVDLALMLRGARDNAQSVAFLVGGAFGLSREVRSLAQRRIRLAPFTLPHELARLVLVEQVYRAGTIVRGEPYHK